MARPSVRIESTWFNARWAEYCRRRRLAPSAPLERVTMSAADLRRDALEFFSWGCVHQAIARERLEELLPDSAAATPDRL